MEDIGVLVGSTVDSRYKYSVVLKVLNTVQY